MTYIELLQMSRDLLAENTAMRRRLAVLENGIGELRKRKDELELADSLRKLQGRDCSKHNVHAMSPADACPLCADSIRSKFAARSG